MREDDLKSTFEQLRAAPMPARALTADDVIRGGEAVRKRRRTMAVVGSGVGTTAIVAAAVLVLAFKPGDVPTGPVEPASPSSTTSVQESAESSPPSTSPAVRPPVESRTSERAPVVPPGSTTASPSSRPAASTSRMPVVPTGSPAGATPSSSTPVGSTSTPRSG